MAEGDIWQDLPDDVWQDLPEDVWVDLADTEGGVIAGRCQKGLLLHVY